jgi:hypothetical protein
VTGDIIVFEPPAPVIIVVMVVLWLSDFGELQALRPSSSATYKPIDAPNLQPLNDTIASTPVRV